jgi:hypothetical protein
MPGISNSARTEEEGERTGFHTRDLQRLYDGGGGRKARVPYPGSATALRRRRREEGPGSIPGICKGATTEEEGGRPGFHTRDLQRRYDEGGGRKAWVPYPGSATALGRRRRKVGPGSIPWICNGATTEEEG